MYNASHVVGFSAKSLMLQSCVARLVHNGVQLLYLYFSFDFFSIPSSNPQVSMFFEAASCIRKIQLSGSGLCETPSRQNEAKCGLSSEPHCKTGRPATTNHKTIIALILSSLGANVFLLPSNQILWVSSKLSTRSQHHAQSGVVC